MLRPNCQISVIRPVRHSVPGALIETRLRSGLSLSSHSISDATHAHPNCQLALHPPCPFPGSSPPRAISVRLGFGNLVPLPKVRCGRGRSLYCDPHSTKLLRSGVLSFSCNEQGIVVTRRGTCTANGGEQHIAMQTHLQLTMASLPPPGCRSMQLQLRNSPVPWLVRICLEA